MRELLLESCTSGKDILGLMHEKGVRVEDLVENLDSYELMVPDDDQVVSKKMAFLAFNAFIDAPNFHEYFYAWHTWYCAEKGKDKQRVIFDKGIRPNKFVQKLRRHLKDKRSKKLALKDHMENEYLALNQDSACFYLFGVFYDFLDTTVRWLISMHIDIVGSDMFVEKEVMEALANKTTEIELPKTVGEIIPPANILSIRAENHQDKFWANFMRTNYYELLGIVIDPDSYHKSPTLVATAKEHVEEFETYMAAGLGLVLYVKGVFEETSPLVQYLYSLADGVKYSRTRMTVLAEQHPITVIMDDNISHAEFHNDYDSTLYPDFQNVLKILQYAHITRVAPSFERELGPCSNGSSSSSSGKSSKPYVKPTFKVVHLPHVVMPRGTTKKSEPTGKKHIFRGRRETVRNYNHDRYINMKGKSQVIRAITDPLGEKPTEIIYSVRTPKGYAKDSKPVTGKES
jgi:hypothetical protein